MARKGNNPDKVDTDQETGSKRRYQSPQTPPQAPRSRTQQGREQGRKPDGLTEQVDREDREDLGHEHQHGRGMSQAEVEREEGIQGRQGQQQNRQPGQQDWQDDAEDDRSFDVGTVANRGADFDLQKASRDELNAIAQELNIDEYDTMTREELVIEIRERS